MGRSFSPSPSEWLLALTLDRAHQRLLSEEGNLASAAWRLARARCLTSELASEVPTGREVRGAAREILTKLGQRDVPSLASLVAECEASGLLVV